jgi:hypothetical protein
MQIDFPTNKLAQNVDYVKAFFPFFLRLLLYDEPKQLKPYFAHSATMADRFAVPQEIARKLVMAAGAILGQNALIAISSSAQVTAHSLSSLQSCRTWRIRVADASGSPFGP